jgi:hypothetical protein
MLPSPPMADKSTKKSTGNNSINNKAKENKKHATADIR